MEDLVAWAEDPVRRLAGRTVWMVNSTAKGGGIAEMMPHQVALLRELGVQTEWVVIDSEDTRFFRLTKHLHNLIHGHGVADLAPSDRELHEGVNRRNAPFLAARIRPGDLLVVHDPQPMPLASILKEQASIRAVWCCHIGLDEQTPATRAAWEFLAPFAGAYDHGVFSAIEYVPPSFRDRSTIIRPAINPVSDKNRELHLHKLVGVLTNSGLANGSGPLITGRYEATAERLQPDGSFVEADQGEDIGLLTRPIVTQISRWDVLKGFLPLLHAFAELKRTAANGGCAAQPHHRRRLELVRLVLAGPDAGAIQDDPEAKDILNELRSAYRALERVIQRDVVVLSLPIASVRRNALMTNALQRASTIVVQNSLREGFGLTVTEAMWKRLPILTNSQACGPRQQVVNGEHGRVVDDPTDTRALADAMNAMLADGSSRERWGRAGQRRVRDEFLLFAQVKSWLRLLSRLVA